MVRIYAIGGHHDSVAATLPDFAQGSGKVFRALSTGLDGKGMTVVGLMAVEGDDGCWCGLWKLK
jgi:hypothetical protein